MKFKEIIKSFSECTVTLNLSTHYPEVLYVRLRASGCIDDTSITRLALPECAVNKNMILIRRQTRVQKLLNVIYCHSVQNRSIWPLDSIDISFYVMGKSGYDENRNISQRSLDTVGCGLKRWFKMCMEEM